MEMFAQWKQYSPKMSSVGGVHFFKHLKNYLSEQYVCTQDEKTSIKHSKKN